MKPHAIVVLAEAQAEIEGAFLWYRERTLLAADAFRVEIIAAIDSLTTTADMWTDDDTGVRHDVLHRFPYTLHDEFDGRTVTVLAMAHQRRRPDDWRHR